MLLHRMTRRITVITNINVIEIIHALFGCLAMVWLIDWSIVLHYVVVGRHIGDEKGGVWVEGKRDEGNGRAEGARDAGFAKGRFRREPFIGLHQPPPFLHYQEH